MADTPSNIFNLLLNADFPYPMVTLRDGRSMKLDVNGYSILRELPNRSDREKVMSTFYRSMRGFRRTLGASLDGHVQQALFFAKERKYSSALDRSMDYQNIPLSVYTRLIDGVNRNLPVFHRYLKLRQRMLGVEQLHS